MARARRERFALLLLLLRASAAFGARAMARSLTPRPRRVGLILKLVTGLMLGLLVALRLMRESADLLALGTTTAVGASRSAFPVVIVEPQAGQTFEGGGGIGSLDGCAALALHEEGRWKHQHYAPHAKTRGNESTGEPNATATDITGRYLPREIGWLQGLRISWEDCKAVGRKLTGLMYTSQLGNQCGYRVTGFCPSHSEWVLPPGNDTGNSVTNAQPETPRKNRSATRLAADGRPAAADGFGPRHRGDPADDSPTLRLVERLATANKTLCFAGDSIDLQFYYALRNNLLCALRLRERDGDRPTARPGANASVAAERLIPVAYTNATSGPVDYSIYWMCMREIRETLVTLRRGDGGERVARIWFFKMYGRSPWITFFMDECDVLILNLGLHYDARGAMIGQHYGPNRLEDDFRAAVTFLAGFACPGPRGRDGRRSGDPRCRSTSGDPSATDTTIGEVLIAPSSPGGPPTAAAGVRFRITTGPTTRGSRGCVVRREASRHPAKGTTSRAPRTPRARRAGPCTGTSSTTASPRGRRSSGGITRGT